MMEIQRKKKFLFRQKPKKQKDYVIAAFDIETNGLGGDFIEGCISFEDMPGEHFFFSSADTLFTFMVDHPRYRYYAHNGGNYDFCYLVASILRLQREHNYRVDVIRQGQSKIIGFKAVRENNHDGDSSNRKRRNRKTTLDIRDSYALIPVSLAKAAETFCPELPKLKTIDFEGGEIYDPNNEIHKEYLKRDCDALIGIIRKYTRKIYDLFGVDVGYTAGATAIRCWQAHIPEGHVYYRMSNCNEEWSREAYYGGYVHPGYQTGKHNNVISIDFNAAYAAAMLKGVPTGNPFGTYNYYPQYFGIYEVVAHVPRTIPFPCIPSRDHLGMLQWRTGTFTTRITSLEIEWAKQRGCTFDIVEGIVWERWEYPFNEFLTKCQELELEGGELKEIAKLKRNSLYGKFGSKLEQQSLVLSRSEPGDGYQPLINEQSGSLIDGVWTIGEDSDSAYVQPHWAATITAHQRLKMFEIMEGVGIECFRYGDTDSIKADASAIHRIIDAGLVRVGKVYGDIKIDEEYQWFESLGVKNYHGIKFDGNYIAKVKGIPKRLLNIEQMEKAAKEGISESIHFVGMNAPLQLIKGKQINVSQQRKRRIGSLVNSKSWKVHANGMIRPIHYEREKDKYASDLWHIGVA